MAVHLALCNDIKPLFRHQRGADSNQRDAVRLIFGRKDGGRSREMEVNEFQRVVEFSSEATTVLGTC